MTTMPLRFARLRPVLLGTATLLLAAVVVEIWAAERYVDELRITIGPSASGLSDEEVGSRDADDLRAPIDATHERARLAARRGELDVALPKFEELLLAHPTNAHLRGELGFWLLSAGRLNDARKVLSEASGSAGEGRHDAWVVYLHGRAEERTDHDAAAEEAYRRAIAIRSGYGDAKLALGLLLLRSKRFGEAIKILEEAAASGSNEDVARANVALGRAYLLSGKEQDARRVFAAAINRAPAAVDLRIRVARSYMSRKKGDDLERARAVLQEAELIAPDMPQVQGAKGRVLELLGDLDQAEDVYRRALRLDPGYLFARRRLVRLALERDDFALARLQVRRLLETSDENREHHFLAGLVEAAAGDLDAARKHYRDAIDRANGDYPEALLNLGRVEKKAGDLDAAIAIYRRALELRPNYEAALTNLGAAYVAAERWDEAESTYRALLARDPKNPRAWFHLGAMHSDRGDPASAVAAYEKAVALQHDYLKALINLGVAQRRLGRIEEATKTYRKVIAIRPRYAGAWYNIGVAQAKGGNVDEAREAYEKALELDPTHVSARKGLARLEREAKRFPEARALYAEILDATPDAHDERVRLAEVLRDLGDRAACGREVERVLQADSGHQKALRVKASCSEPR